MALRQAIAEKAAGIKTKILSAKTVFLAGLLLVGFAAGFLVSHQIVQPMLNQELEQDLNTMKAINQSLDEQIDSYYSCLNSFGIEGDTCQKKS
jgi:hypothetical protein